ncbi:Alpha/Beta hydrolase protein [Infundibulicybe gibba]|nr:Alpha/Beta hydrolase protein [Infundibulicybe gibba]
MISLLTKQLVRPRALTGLRFNSIQAPHFPCSRLMTSLPPDSGPEPPYARPNPTSYKTYHHSRPLALTYASYELPSFDIAYETWGTLSAAKDNVILLHTGLSASSHAASTPANTADGWWEKFIGPGKALDTNTFFIICTNVLGGCYGSTGPSSTEPSTGKPYGTRFPIVSIFDMVRAQYRLLDHLGIEKLYASVGCSMGAMQSLAAGWLHPERVGKIVSISGTARSTPSSVAMRYAQRSEIATITYRSGPEWDQRFGRHLRRPPSIPRGSPGEQFCLKYDANSLIYISKAMDLFDMTLPALQELRLSAPSKPSASLRGPIGARRCLRMAGNNQVSYYELGGVWGHDTFLIDVLNVGGAIRGFLS